MRSPQLTLLSAVLTGVVSAHLLAGSVLSVQTVWHVFMMASLLCLLECHVLRSFSLLSSLIEVLQWPMTSSTTHCNL